MYLNFYNVVPRVAKTEKSLYLTSHYVFFKLYENKLKLSEFYEKRDSIFKKVISSIKSKFYVKWHTK